MYLKGLKGQFSIEFQLLQVVLFKSKMYNEHYFQSDSIILSQNLMIFGQKLAKMDLIPCVLKCIPVVKFPKYTYTLVQFNTVAPPQKNHSSSLGSV